jgi:hypothetical protein
VDELIGATGWLPHTARAALTGLRQKGFVLKKSQRIDGKGDLQDQVHEPQCCMPESDASDGCEFGTQN